MFDVGYIVGHRSTGLFLSGAASCINMLLMVKIDHKHRICGTFSMFPLKEDVERKRKVFQNRVQLFYNGVFDEIDMDAVPRKVLISYFILFN
ncbi:hypothetical protein L596_010158 [Steinernema carpocapsae]|uniref:Uncharacterized protein n=1 Tax=Steinernema carpocapsae TaxID=34508 RepID=A0A4U5PHI2_STECR|nr:hypothetical protein L596_010158 [Steinernema carpocapsae]